MLQVNLHHCPRMERAHAHNVFFSSQSRRPSHCQSVMRQTFWLWPRCFPTPAPKSTKDASVACRCKETELKSPRKAFGCLVEAQETGELPHPVRSQLTGTSGISGRRGIPVVLHASWMWASPYTCADAGSPVEVLRTRIWATLACRGFRCRFCSRQGANPLEHGGTWACWTSSSSSILIV